MTVGLQINTTAQQAAGKSPASQLNPTLLALAFWWPGGLTGLAVFLRKRKLVENATFLAASPALRLHVRLSRWSIGLWHERNDE